MNNKPNVAVIAGGDSSEFVVSVKSGANVYSAIDTGKVHPMDGADERPRLGCIQQRNRNWQLSINLISAFLTRVQKGEF
jgi:D-alanine-D-alanine ligase-like ATP-grasp enzyme